VAGDTENVCTRVLAAGEEARRNVAALEYASAPDVIESFKFGLALHVGQLLYGNIGGGNRLDFTCIGPAVNLTSRLEKIAGRLGRTIVASSAFADVCGDGWHDLGKFPIAGFAEPQHVYGRSDENAPAD
jgi:adenylate cyclase